MATARGMGSRGLTRSGGEMTSLFENERSVSARATPLNGWAARRFPNASQTGF
jgi:hypothetical protein